MFQNSRNASISSPALLVNILSNKRRSFQAETKGPRRVGRTLYDGMNETLAVAPEFVTLARRPIEAPHIEYARKDLRECHI